MTYKASLIECVSAPVFALSSGRNGAFLAWNRALSGISGIASVDAVGRTPVEVLGPAAAGVSLAPPGIFNIPGLGMAVIERHEDILIGTLEDYERDAFIGMAAHDLRAPLRNILYLAETVLSDPTRNQNLVSKMANVARNGLALTSDLVACAQSLELGEQPMAEVALRPLAARILSTLENGPELTCSNVTVMVEKPILMIVLRNLLDNAIRHGNARRNIKIDVSPCEIGIEVRVFDNGAGFKESSLAFLSGGDFRVESGYGLLGLRRMLHARGGRIGVEPAKTGKGSAVVVTLPGSFVEGDRIAIAS